MESRKILQNCIGTSLNEIVLEWFYLDKNPVDIIFVYMQFNNWIRILCDEEDVFISEIKERPNNHCSGKFEYIIINQNITPLKQLKLIEVKYLLDEHQIKRGVLFIFENNNNICYYNKGYEFDEKVMFKINILKEEIPYMIVDFN